jgi:hypothetical protein
MLARWILFAASVTSAAGAIVQIDSTVYGCAFPQCSGGPSSIPVGTVVNLAAFPKLQLTLGPGTYNITNAATTGYYSAWNFSGGWVWSFIMADDATSTVLLSDYVNIAPQASQAAAAGATGVTTLRQLTSSTTMTLPGTSTAGFIDTFTLASTTTLDFFADDYFLADNAGGVALNVTAASQEGVPEPASVILCGGALGIIAAGRRLRNSRS